jgi:hypothetical protein
MHTIDTKTDAHIPNTLVDKIYYIIHKYSDLGAYINDFIFKTFFEIRKSLLIFIFLEFGATRYLCL